MASSERARSGREQKEISTTQWKYKAGGAKIKGYNDCMSERKEDYGIRSWKTKGVGQLKVTENNNYMLPKG